MTVDSNDHACLLAQVTVLKRVAIMLAQQQSEIALTHIRAALAKLAGGSEQSSQAYGEGIGQTATRLLDELR